MTPPRPKLLTFDLFGTVIDWRRGLREALAKLGRDLSDPAFERVIDRQGELESGPHRLYRDIVAQSLISVLGIEAGEALRIGEAAGTWPLYEDSRDAIRSLMTIAPCVPMTNSDRAHRAQIEAQLGFEMSGWICAEDVRAYKPSVQVWEHARLSLGLPFGPEWWHVSAYADYDLATARSLRLTCVFIERSHARPGSAEIVVPSLKEIAQRAESAK
jgi:2-haloalkanoic acid dehalogenase type II